MLKWEFKDFDNLLLPFSGTHQPLQD